MKIKHIRINNFRLLKNVSVDLEDTLSLVLGKNNCGKTSFLIVLDKFLNSGSFTIEDFNLDLQKKIKTSIKTEIQEDQYKASDYSISLFLDIEYVEADNLKNVSNLILDLNPAINTLILSFEYCLAYEGYKKLFSDFETNTKSNPDADIIKYLGKNHAHYFKILKKSIEVGNEANFIEVENSDLQKVVCLQTIHARRDVANGDKKENRTLSRLSSKYYKAKKEKDTDISDISDLQKKLAEADVNLTGVYKTFFDPVIESIKKFSSITHDAPLEIVSALEEFNLLEENTLVRYNQSGHNLPESYNGLGYMNLFAIIFDIHIKLDEFRKQHSENESPADINILFIEEPEAHTHPQMQYIFIKNIKHMLEDTSKGKINLQTIITTHSSHIASQSEFNDIKYFSLSPTDSNSVDVKNLSELQNVYESLGEEDSKKDKAGQDTVLKAQKSNFDFLKKYLTLNNSELFFADKAVFIEGDSERILLPSFMRKIDKAHEKEKGYIALLSQNISIVEVGNYAHVFDKFLNFLNIKALIVTDIDSIGVDTKVCPVSSGVNTSNASIKYFLDGKKFSDIKALDIKEKVLRKEKGKYVKDAKGNIMLCYQTEHNGYHARSFEDAFISTNLSFIFLHKDSFDCLQNRDKIEESSTDFFDIATKCIKKKSSFASDVLFHSAEDSKDWATPKYIQEGLEWLAR